jgi:hypothetical protein
MHACVRVFMFTCVSVCAVANQAGVLGGFLHVAAPYALVKLEDCDIETSWVKYHALLRAFQRFHLVLTATSLSASVFSFF